MAQGHGKHKKHSRVRRSDLLVGKLNQGKNQTVSISDEGRRNPVARQPNLGTVLAADPEWLHGGGNKAGSQVFRKSRRQKKPGKFQVGQQAGVQ